MPALEAGYIRIRNRGVARVRNGHLWVYRSDILEVIDVTPGGIATVRDERDSLVGKAFYSSQSQIALRFLVRSDTPIDEAFFRARFEEAEEFRRRMGVDPVVSRLIYSEGDFLPGLIVDRYDEILVLQSLTQGADRLQPLFTSLLRERYQPRTVIFRNDSKVRELEGLPLERYWVGSDVVSSIWALI